MKQTQTAQTAQTRSYKNIASIDDGELGSHVAVLAMTAESQVTQYDNQEVWYCWCFSKGVKFQCQVRPSNFDTSKPLLHRNIYVSIRGKLSPKLRNAGEKILWVDDCIEIKNAQIPLDGMEWVVTDPSRKALMRKSSEPQKWNGLNENEVALLQSINLPSGYFIIPQVKIKNYTVDFGVYRRSDCGLEYIIEIDGSSHDGRMIQDHMRQKEICKAAGIPFENFIRRSAREIFEQRRRMGFSPPQNFG